MWGEGTKDLLQPVLLSSFKSMRKAIQIFLDISVEQLWCSLELLKTLEMIREVRVETINVPR